MTLDELMESLQLWKDAGYGSFEVRISLESPQAFELGLSATSVEAYRGPKTILIAHEGKEEEKK